MKRKPMLTSKVIIIECCKIYKDNKFELFQKIIVPPKVQTYSLLRFPHARTRFNVFYQVGVVLFEVYWRCSHNCSLNTW